MLNPDPYNLQPEPLNPEPRTLNPLTTPEPNPSGAAAALFGLNRLSDNLHIGVVSTDEAA